VLSVNQGELLSVQRLTPIRMLMQRQIGILLLWFLIVSVPWVVAQVDHGTVLADPQGAGVQHRAHLHDKDDVNAIGTRRIGGKGLGNWYSLESEIQMGKQYAEIVESTSTLLRDPMITEYVNRIGQNLVHNSDAKVPFTIKVIDSDEINAFALPGGFLYVTSGLILAAADEAELAGVMAHEIAHVAAHHATRQMTRSNLINLISIPLIFLGGPVGSVVQQAASLAVPLGMMKFSRSFELEADYLGVEYLYKTGYDPQAFISFFERIEVRKKEKPGKLAMVFSTHPQTIDRIRKTQQEITRILPGREFYIVSTSDFEETRVCLAAIESRRVTLQQEHDRPVLRRRAPSQNHDSQDDGPTPRLRNH
jgi:Zn-dependent protease with chaperone function